MNKICYWGRGGPYTFEQSSVSSKEKGKLTYEKVHLNLKASGVPGALFYTLQWTAID